MIKQDSKIIVYGLTTCPFCIEAKKLLEQNNLKYQYINCDSNKQEIKLKNNYPTFPQIFIDNQLIGGYKELTELI